MKKPGFVRRYTTAALAAMLFALPLAASAQTRITMPKNKYPVQDDVQLGNQAANQINHQFPLINDADAQAYLDRVGARLVAAIPSEFNQPAFNYRFRWVNANDLNAFALPGGPMYVDRGMLESAHNEGEMAGVMAHEISHVALRHATAQQTKNTSAGSTLRTLGLILGGAMVGGQAGAQLGQVFAQGFALKYSREYESQADTLGAQIMARAGYDPRDLANVFQTIAQESRGGGGGGWLSSHPDPGNRYQKINAEAGSLQVSPTPIKITRDFERVQAKFHAMPRARSMSEIEQAGGNYNNGPEPNGGGGYPSNGGGDPRAGSGGNGASMAGGRYTSAVAAPARDVRAFTAGPISFSVPSNWEQFMGQSNVEFAPQGAFGDQGITHGLMAGLLSAKSRDLARDTDGYVDEVLQGNSYLQKRGGLTQTTLGGRQAYSIQLAGTSPVTRRPETVTVYTTQLRDGNLVYFITVVPQAESATYSYVFRNIANSLRFND